MSHASAFLSASMSSKIFFAGPLRRSGFFSQRQTVERWTPMSCPIAV